jgi:CRP-like cAMP-binding protein
MNAQILATLTQNSDFQQLWKKYKFLTSEDLMQLMSIGNIQNLSKNEYFIKAGERSKKVGFIINGLVRLYHLKDGEEYNIVFKHELQMVSSFESIILNQPSSYNLEALEDTIMMTYNYDEMETIFSQNPQLERFGRYFIQQELAQAVKIFEKHLFYSPEERYLKFIEENPDLMNRVSLKHLSSFLGITPVSLSRIRKRVSDLKH